MARDSSSTVDLRTRVPTGDPAGFVTPAAADPEEFGAIYDRYLSPVYKYCFRRLPTTEDAEDATSLVFAKALATLSHQREERAVRSWLFTIAHNVVADHYRARRLTLDLTNAVGVVDTAGSPEARVLAAEELRSLLVRLPADQARILELRLAGLTGAEIAGVLGKSPTAVKVAQFRAYSKLRELVDQPAGRTEVRHDTR